MAIDYIVDLSCAPKQALGKSGILERLKGKARAETIIRLFREQGDARPPSAMGFEFVRSTAAGEEETQIVIVQELLDQADELMPHTQHCVGCPANVRGVPFGCIDAIQYPLTAEGERWLMARLPGIEQPLLWLLLRQGIHEHGYDGAPVASLRSNGVYFESATPISRDMQDFSVNSDQIFEMIFLLGPIQPAHAGMLLQFFDAVPRATEANQIVQIMNGLLTPDQIEQQFPMLIVSDSDDDRIVADIKRFLAALHAAWRLSVPVILDV